MHEGNEHVTDDMYLPAISLDTDFSRIEALLGTLLDAHGVVPIPDSYNK